MDGRSMNSLELSAKTLSVADAASSPAPGKATVKGGSFLSLLVAAGKAASTDKTTPEATTESELDSSQVSPSDADAPASGLPNAGKNGKLLPVRLRAVAAAASLSPSAANGVLPGAATQPAENEDGEQSAKADPDGKQAVEGTAVNTAAATLLLSPFPPSITPPVEAAATKTDEAGARALLPARQALARSASNSDLSPIAKGGSKEPLTPQSIEPPASHAVAIHFAESAAQPPTAARQDKTPSPAEAAPTHETRSTDAAVQLLGTPATVSSMQTPLIAHAAPPHIDAGAAPRLAVAPLAGDGPAHDLTQIVDRLAAAREALAPAAAALAVHHADFGDLSLRFDQQRDGQLTVHIAASSPDAQRAMMAAASQQPPSGTPHHHAGAGEHLAHSHGRDASAARDGASHGSGGNQGQPRQHHTAARHEKPIKSPQQRPGVFA